MQLVASDAVAQLKCAFCRKASSTSSLQGNDNETAWKSAGRNGEPHCGYENAATSNSINRIRIRFEESFLIEINRRASLS